MKVNWSFSAANFRRAILSKADRSKLLLGAGAIAALALWAVVHRPSSTENIGLGRTVKVSLAQKLLDRSKVEAKLKADAKIQSAKLSDTFQYSGLEERI